METYISVITTKPLKFPTIAIALLIIGVVNASILPSEKVFFAFEFLLAIFGAISIQKNTIKQIALSQYLRGGSSNQSNFWRAIYDGCLL